MWPLYLSAMRPTKPFVPCTSPSQRAIATPTPFLNTRFIFVFQMSKASRKSRSVPKKGTEDSLAPTGFISNQAPQQQEEESEHSETEEDKNDPTKPRPYCSVQCYSRFAVTHTGRCHAKLCRNTSWKDGSPLKACARCGITRYCVRFPISEVAGYD